jgi:hypothetical protein
VRSLINRSVKPPCLYFLTRSLRFSSDVEFHLPDSYQVRFNTGACRPCRHSRGACPRFRGEREFTCPGAFGPATTPGLAIIARTSKISLHVKTCRIARLNVQLNPLLYGRPLFEGLSLTSTLSIALPYSLSAHGSHACSDSGVEESRGAAQPLGYGLELRAGVDDIHRALCDATEYGSEHSEPGAPGSESPSRLLPRWPSGRSRRSSGSRIVPCGVLGSPPILLCAPEVRPSALGAAVPCRTIGSILRGREVYLDVLDAILVAQPFGKPKVPEQMEHPRVLGQHHGGEDPDIPL